MIRPRGRVCLLSAAIGCLALAGEAGAMSMPGWAAALAGLVALASVADLLLAARYPLPEIRRELPPHLPHQRPTPIKVHLANPQRSRLHLHFQERLSSRAVAELEPASQRIVVPGGHSATFHYQLTARSRGLLLFDRCQLYVSGPLGLWSLRRYLSLPQRTLVGADLDQLGTLARAGGEQALTASLEPEPGVHTVSAGELVIWLDTPPSLASAWDGVKGLDQARDIAMTVADLALSLGGRCGLQLDPGQRRAGLASAGGPAQLQRLYRRLGEVQPSAQPNDPMTAIQSLLQRCGPGSQVLWITRLSFDTLALIAPLKQLASGRRLLIADLLDERLASQLEQPLRDARTAQAYCLARQAQGQRDRAHERLASVGLEVYSGVAGQLTQAVIRWYARTASGAEWNGQSAPQAEALMGRKLK